MYDFGFSYLTCLFVSTDYAYCNSYFTLVLKVFWPFFFRESAFRHFEAMECRTYCFPILLRKMEWKNLFTVVGRILIRKKFDWKKFMALFQIQLGNYIFDFFIQKGSLSWTYIFSMDSWGQIISVLPHHFFLFGRVNKNTGSRKSVINFNCQLYSADDFTIINWLNNWFFPFKSTIFLRE